MTEADSARNIYWGEIGQTSRRAYATAPRVQVRALRVDASNVTLTPDRPEKFAAGCNIISMYYEHIIMTVKVRATLM